MHSSDSGLVRGIRRWDLVALVLNVIIGAGIFGLPSQAFARSGSYSLVAYAICAVLVILIVLCFAEVGSRFKVTGGPYLYVREAFGPIAGFQTGWLLWIARLTAYASLMNLLVNYLGYFWPAVTEGSMRVIFITAVTVALTAVNVVGVRRAALTSDIFTVGKLIPLILFIVVGLFFINPQNFNFSLDARPLTADFSRTVLLLVFAFSGFEMATIPSGELRDPGRHIPFALLTGISIVVLLYMAIQFVSIGTLPELADSTRPLADAGSRFLGPAGASIMALGALISITGTLNAIVLAGPRLLFAMGEQGQLPAIFAATHPRYRTPYVAIVVSAVVMYVFTLRSSFISALTISTIIRLVTYAATCAALPVLRRRPSAAPAGFKVPAGGLVTIAALLLCAWLLSFSEWKDARLAIASAVAGFVLYGLVLLGKRKEVAVGAEAEG